MKGDIEENSSKQGIIISIFVCNCVQFNKTTFVLNKLSNQFSG